MSMTVTIMISVVTALVFIKLCNNPVLRWYYVHHYVRNLCALYLPLVAILTSLQSEITVTTSLCHSLLLSFSVPLLSSIIQFISFTYIPTYIWTSQGILNLGGNPVGIAGGTSLMETLNYYICDRWVMLHGCTYPTDNQESTSRCTILQDSIVKYSIV